ncbi:MAG: hypothetical protein ACHBNF_22465 [Chromatiales bacterium]
MGRKHSATILFDHRHGLPRIFQIGLPNRADDEKPIYGVQCDPVRVSDKRIVRKSGRDRRPWFIGLGITDDHVVRAQAG